MFKPIPTMSICPRCCLFDDAEQRKTWFATTRYNNSTRDNLGLGGPEEWIANAMYAP